MDSAASRNALVAAPREKLSDLAGLTETESRYGSPVALVNRAAKTDG